MVFQSVTISLHMGYYLFAFQNNYFAFLIWELISLGNFGNILFLSLEMTFSISLLSFSETLLMDTRLPYSALRMSYFFLIIFIPLGVWTLFWVMVISFTSLPLFSLVVSNILLTYLLRVFISKTLFYSRSIIFFPTGLLVITPSSILRLVIVLFCL